MRFSYRNLDAFSFLALIVAIILVLAMVLNIVFIRRLLIAMKEKDLDSTKKFGSRLKYFILCQAISFVPSFLVSQILYLFNHDVIVIILNFIMALSCYRSFIFIYIYGCTEGLKSKVKEIKLFTSSETAQQQLEPLELDFEEECNRSISSKNSSVKDKKRASEVFEYQINKYEFNSA